VKEAVELNMKIVRLAIAPLSAKGYEFREPVCSAHPADELIGKPLYFLLAS